MNGSGKSTLLKSISQLERTKREGCLLVEQELFVDEDINVYDYVLSSNTALSETLKRLQILENSDEDEQPDDFVELYESLQNKLNNLEFNKQNSIIQRILHGLGFVDGKDKNKIVSFSGGWRMRISLGKK